MAASLNIKSLDVDALLALRGEIDRRLTEKRRLLEQQLSMLAAEPKSNGAAARAASFDRRKISALKGRKIEPKYCGPNGETWAGRGAQPRWLSTALKSGKKLDDFLIDKAAPAARKPARKVRAKRQ